MNNMKSFGVIDQDKIDGNIHIVGCGAIGSLAAENLIRLNLVSKIIAYDFDEVEDKNLNNQAYLRKHIGMAKVEALKDLAAMIDEDKKLRIKNKKVDYIRTKSSDIVILALDNYEARANIIANLEGSPLLVVAGANARGGNVEVVRGDYSAILEEYKNLPSGQEYDQDDMTACGSPISIYHRIRTIASIVAEEVVNNYNNTNSINKNILLELPSMFLVTE